RDGMNLVAKEFVAAQDPDDPGVLVLSEFAGAAEQLPQALIVNPHDPRQQADAVARALAMDLAERRERHAAMMDTLARRDASWWCAAFLRELDRCEGTNPANTIAISDRIARFPPDRQAGHPDARLSQSFGLTLGKAAG
ncbi:hypothetical protein FKB34_15560, partial [Glycocaulis profundi]